MKAKIQLGAMIILVVLVVSLILSQNANPDMPPFFFLKRLQEKVFLKTKSTPQDKVEYMSGLLESRLSELQNQVNNKSYDYILSSALRYSTLAGQITDLIVANNLTDQVAETKNQFLSHKKALDTVYIIYPKNTDNVEWKYIQDDYNYLGLYLNKLAKVK